MSMFMTPGSTTARKFAVSISRMRFIRVTASTMPPRCAPAPPLSPVPAPLATTGTPRRAAIATTAETSAVEDGSTTAAGIALSTEPSYS